MPSAPLPPSVLRRFEAATGLPVVETYGMTEAASMITANPLDGPRKPGRPRFESCPAFEVGQVQIRGPGVIRRYAPGGPPGAIDRDGWLDTGDLGHLDADGYLFLAGRSDDVINRGGEKIYPREIEDFLLSQPGVSAAAVVAAPDPVLGACPAAYIVATTAARDPGLAAALREACAAALPRPMRPGTLRLLDALPLTPAGKTDRKLLSTLAKS